MTCADCGAPCQGSICRQCETQRKFEHLADDLATGDPWDRDDDTEGDDD